MFQNSPMMVLSQPPPIHDQVSFNPTASRIAMMNIQVKFTVIQMAVASQKSRFLPVRNRQNDTVTDKLCD